MDKIRILHVIGGGEIGGAEDVVFTLMKLLDPDKFEPYLICLCPGPFAPLVREYGFQAVIIPMKHRMDLSVQKTIQDYIHNNKIDLVHTHGVRANMVARKAGKIEGIPVVTTFHSSLQYDYDNMLKAWLAISLTRLNNKHTDHFIAISKAIQQDLINMGVSGDKITVIHNGLDTSKFMAPRNPQLIRKDLGLDINKKVIAMIARLHPVKGHEYFLKAARQVLDAGMNVQFLIIGDGILQEQIEKWIDELDLAANVIMPGYYERIEDIYAITDILCVPSIMEGLGLVILEAMYFNVPVIASNTGGIPEIIDDRVDGMLVKPRDHQMLARTILEVINNEGLQGSLKRQGQVKLNLFTVENMAHKIQEVYQKLLFY